MQGAGRQNTTQKTLLVIWMVNKINKMVKKTVLHKHTNQTKSPKFCPNFKTTPEAS